MKLFSPIWWTSVAAVAMAICWNGSLIAVNGKDATNWASISPLLESTFKEYLPPAPNTILRGHVNVSGDIPFQTYVSSLGNANTADVMCPSGESMGESLGSGLGGWTCSGVGYEAGTQHCRAKDNLGSIAVSGKLGTSYWQRQLAVPGWIIYRFPALQKGVSTVTLSYTLDSRYAPELYGGNPCPNATAYPFPAYRCRLCTEGEWDYSASPGAYVLWSSVGRDRWFITGPFDLVKAFNRGNLTQIHDAPAELGLEPGEEVLVSVFVFSQYANTGEIAVSNPSRCSVAETGTTSGNLLMVKSAKIFYRTTLSLRKEPGLGRPRLFGNDTEWHNKRNLPFYSIGCDNQATASPGWGGKRGVQDFKGLFEKQTLGYNSCSEKDIGTDISKHWAASAYFSYQRTNVKPSRLQGRASMHLLRRMWACHEAGIEGAVSPGPCQFNQSETVRLAEVFAATDLSLFTTWAWQDTANFYNDYDLGTPEALGYWSMFVDLFEGRDGYVTKAQIKTVTDKLTVKIDVFMKDFYSGYWNLWNGNNWTPFLCQGAMYWAVAFWHEDPRASIVLAMVNDLLWLHVPYYTEDGVYTEGLAMYSFMSIDALLQISSMQMACFGLPQGALVALKKKLRLLPRYYEFAMATDGQTINFGDSHKKRGWGGYPYGLYAMMIDLVLQENIEKDTLPLSREVACFVRSHFSNQYYLSAVDPWILEPSLAAFNWTNIVGRCSIEPSQPLGGDRAVVLGLGGYAALRIPLLLASSTEGNNAPNICFGITGKPHNLCTDPTLPSVADNIPYSFLALQARPNSFSHSEVDFGTFVWTAWGTRLLSEYGYGTIATAVGNSDTRRYSHIDNNPAGHNTVIIREAYLRNDNSSRINFSQMNKNPDAGMVVGVYPAGHGSGNPTGCLMADGSPVYGSDRPARDGWFSSMLRYVCPLEEGHFIIIDAFAVLSNRSSLNIYGAQYGGENFDEGPTPHTTLTVDEYFHTETLFTKQNLTWTRTSAERWCSHVDIDLVSSSMAKLAPRCGLGDNRDADGDGYLAGWSLNGGHFINDGLVTATDTSGRPDAMAMNRIRFVGDNKVGTDGDIRAFILAQSPKIAGSGTGTETPMARMASCGDMYGCPFVNSDNALDCACVEVCLESSLWWATIFESELRDLGVVGTCNGAIGGSVYNPSITIRVPSSSVPTPAPESNNNNSVPQATASPTAVPTGVGHDEVLHLNSSRTHRTFFPILFSLLSLSISLSSSFVMVFSQ